MRANGIPNSYAIAAKATFAATFRASPENANGVVSVKSTSTTMRSGPSRSTTSFPLARAHDYFLKIVDAQITFVTDSIGRATELILHQGLNQHAKRIELIG